VNRRLCQLEYERAQSIVTRVVVLEGRIVVQRTQGGDPASRAYGLAIGAMGRAKDGDCTGARENIRRAAGQLAAAERFHRHGRQHPERRGRR
jgi:hypothetical protein